MQVEFPGGRTPERCLKPLEDTPMRRAFRWSAGLCTLSILALAISAGAEGGEKGKPMTLKAGDKAPTFEGVDENGKAWKSTDHIGKKTVVLFFFPAALTGG